MHQATTFPRDGFKVDPCASHRAVVINVKDMIFRAFDTGVKRRNRWVIQNTHLLDRVGTERHLLFKDRNRQSTGWFTAIRKTHKISRRFRHAIGWLGSKPDGATRHSF